MGDWSSKGKTPEEIVRNMEGLGTLPVGNPLPLTMSAAIQVKLVGKLSDTIDVASENFLRQSNDLKEHIGAAREDFVEQSVAFRESLKNHQESLEKFRKSNERSSNALFWVTIVLAFAALVQAATLVYQVVKY